MNTEPYKDNYEFVISVIKSLAKSQGYYARLLHNLEEGDQEEIKDFLNNKAPKFTDSIDVIMWLED